MTTIGPNISDLVLSYPKPQDHRFIDLSPTDDLHIEPEPFQELNLDSPSTLQRFKGMSWTDRICSVARYGGLLFGPAVFITDILYYVWVGFDNESYRSAYLGFLFLQPVLNLVCVILFGTYLLNYTKYKQQRRMGAYVVGCSPCISLLASIKLIGFTTLFSKFASGLALGIWMLILISPIFKTFPLLLIQGLNNSDMGIWTNPLAMLCYVTSVLSCFKEVAELLYYLGGDLLVKERTEMTSYLPKLRASQFYSKGDKVDFFGQCGWPALLVPFCGLNMLNCANLYEAQGERFLATKSYCLEALCCILCLPPLASILLRGHSKMSCCQLMWVIFSCGAYPSALPNTAISLLKD